MEEEQIYSVVISKRAEQNLDKIIDYLIIYWNEKVKLQFIDEFVRIIECLKTTPYMFP